MQFMGADCGKHGCIVVIEGKQIVEVKRSPNREDIKYMCSTYSNAFTTIEKVHSMPRDSNQGAFTFGKNYGWYEQAFTDFNIKYIEVDSRTWLSLYNLSSIKMDSIVKAIHLFPQLKTMIDMKRKDADGIAQAALIALYGRMKHGDR